MAEQTGNIGIILSNIGTPASPDPRDIKPYLIEFLSDKGIVRMPSFIWQPILRGIVANTRPKKTAPRYAHIWTDEGSPLLAAARAQRDGLNERFAAKGLPCRAEIGMHYGSPSLADALKTLQDAGCSRIVFFPLFPQTAYSTVGTGKTRMARALADAPDVTLEATIEGYADNELYLQALTASIEEGWEYRPGRKLLLSFHAIPLSDVANGDTYLDQVERTVRPAAERLGIAPNDWAVSFHSRFDDPRSWTSPTPKAVAEQWVEEGATDIALVTPGFAADCLESLYDIDVVLRERLCTASRERGRELAFTYIPALNDRADHIDALYDVITTSLNLKPTK